MSSMFEALLKALSFSDIHDDPQTIGQIGENCTVSRLKEIDSKELYGIILKNLYVPASNGRTSEVDILFITQKGIFVIESKNYSGWIFGSQSDKTWTARYKSGDTSSFYNPVLQNQNHIKRLENYLGKNIPFFSVIVFSDRCELVKINVNSDVKVIHRYELVKTIKEVCNEYPDIFSKQSVSYISQKLHSLTDVDEGIKLKHIKDLTDKCPYCGRDLVIRISGNGKNSGRKFLGCSGFPNCRYTKSCK